MVEREDNPVELNISPEKIGFIIIKAREFDVKVAPAEPDPGSNPSDDDESEVLEDYPDDATLEELRAIDDAQKSGVATDSEVDAALRSFRGV